MTQAFATTTIIDRPVEQVWKELTDWDRAAGWMPGVEHLHADGDTKPGTKLVLHSRGKDRASEITACTPGRSITLTSHQGGVRADYTYTLQPANGGGTQVSLVADCRTRGLWRLAAPGLRRLIRRADSNQLDALKRQIEAR